MRQCVPEFVCTGIRSAPIARLRRDRHVFEWRARRVTHASALGRNGVHDWLLLGTAAIIESTLPDIPELSRTVAPVGPIKEVIPVIPARHYMMGGIPARFIGQALMMPDKGEDKLTER